jgi:putative ABC transport system permease protein
MIGSLVLDLRYAARRLFHAPLFTASAVIVLAIGIGLNAVVFDLVDTALYRPLPFHDADRVVHIYQDSDNGAPTSTSFPAYRDMAARTDVFTDVAATSAASARWDREDGPRSVAVQYATSSYLAVLGLRPYLGAWFDRRQDRVGAQMAAVVSYATWRSRMDADPSVIGRTVRLNNQSVTIIGVGPETFNGDANALVTDFWLSISGVPVGGPYRVTNLEQRESHWYQVMARLAPGVTVEQARSAMQGLAARLADAYPAINEGRGISVFAQDEVRFHPLIDGPLVGGSVALIAVAALVLLLACSNLANVLLARGVSRSAEIAVRQVLGADRQRIARLLLIEALLLSALGAVAGLAIAAWSVTLLSALSLPSGGPLPGGLSVGFNHRVAIFGTLLTLATGLLFGIVPALRAARTDVAANLRDGGRSHSAGSGVSMLRRALVVAQVAISVVLVTGAGLMVRSLANAERVDAGVDAERIAVIGTDLAQGDVAPEEAPAVVTQLLERMEAVPGVQRAAVTTRLPVQPGGTTTRIIDGYAPPAGTGAVELPVAFVSRGYFETMAIRVLAGRTFTAADGANAPRVIVVNEAAARAYWGGNAVGGRIRGQGEGSEWLEVVGVVGDVKVSDLTEAPTPMIYGSTEQFGVGAFSIVARTSDDPAAVTSGLRAALRDVRSSLPVTRLQTLKQHFGDTLQAPRVGTIVMSAFSTLALMIATLGIYAVVAFTVERRTHELGIRTALGASASRIARMVVRESVVTAALGVAAGLVLAALAMRGLEGVLYGVSPVDAATFVGTGVLLLAAACVAALLPARRATHANPAKLLKSE